MKETQLYSQVFIYILTIFLISFILIYGYNSIKGFIDRAEKVCSLKFRNDISNAVESVSSDAGSIKRKNMQLCGKYTSICFVETFESTISVPPKTDPIIKNSIDSNTGKNVFLVEDMAKESFYVGNISVEPDILCIKAVNNKVVLKLEGKGNHVEISQWSS